MSRSLTTTHRSKHLFVTPIHKLIKQPDGTTELATTSIMSSRSLNGKSVRVNRAWDGEVWLGNEADDRNHSSPHRRFKKKYVSQRCSNSGALFLLTTLLENQTFQNQSGVGCSVIVKMNFDIWKNILFFITGPQNHEQVENVGYYALALQRPVSLFKNAAVYTDTDPRAYLITDCAIRGEEEIVLNILDADSSYLLKTATVKNSVDVEHEVTPLQAAIMANDVQLIERMKPYFERLTTDLDGKPIDGLAEMNRQMIEIYKKSFRQYFDLTEEKIEKLNTEIETFTASIAALEKIISTLNQEKSQKPIDWNELRQAKETLITINQALETATEALTTAEENNAQYYLETLRSDIADTHYLEKLVDTHNNAQMHHKFDFTPYVDVICKIDPNDPELQDVLALIDARTDAETQAAIAKGVSPIEIGFTDQSGRTYSREEVQALPFDQLSLIQKLNRFREKLVGHMQQEIIFNPNHILRGLKENEHVWDEVVAGRISDPNNYAKRAVIFSQLVGWAQRKAAEPVKQDIRQGTWYLTQENERRSRQSRFNTWNNTTLSIDRNFFIDVSVSSPGIVGGVGYKFASGAGRAAGRGGTGGAAAGRGDLFKTYVRQKQQAFRTCYAAAVGARPQVRVCSIVVSC